MRGCGGEGSRGLGGGGWGAARARCCAAAGAWAYRHSACGSAGPGANGLPARRQAARPLLLASGDPLLPPSWPAGRQYPGGTLAGSGGRPTFALMGPHSSSHTVPHMPPTSASSRPSLASGPPARRTRVKGAGGGAGGAGGSGSSAGEGRRESECECECECECEKRERGGGVLSVLRGPPAHAAAGHTPSHAYRPSLVLPPTPPHRPTPPPSLPALPCDVNQQTNKLSKKRLFLP